MVRLTIVFIPLQVEQITAEYKVRALQYHPDKNEGDKEAEAKFQKMKVRILYRKSFCRSEFNEKHGGLFIIQLKLKWIAPRQTTTIRSQKLHFLPKTIWKVFVVQSRFRVFPVLSAFFQWIFSEEENSFYRILMGTKHSFHKKEHFHTCMLSYSNRSKKVGNGDLEEFAPSGNLVYVIHFTWQTP